MVCHTSDSFPIIEKHARQFIADGWGYMDDTPQEQMQAERMEHIESKRRCATVAENQHAFEEMTKGNPEYDSTASTADVFIIILSLTVCSTAVTIDTLTTAFVPRLTCLQPTELCATRFCSAPTPRHHTTAPEPSTRLTRHMILLAPLWTQLRVCLTPSVPPSTMTEMNSKLHQSTALLY